MPRVLIVWLVASCAHPSEPEFPPALIDVDVATGKVVSQGIAGHPGYTLEFAPTAVRLPTSLTAGSSDNLLYAGMGCPEESGIGITMYPAAVATGINGSPGTSTLTVGMTGPAIGRVAVEWSVPYTCGGEQTLAGTSTFTLFPTGRIVRTDANVVSSTTQLVYQGDGVQCGCSSDTRDLFFETHWAFVAGIDKTPTDGTPPPPPTDIGDRGCTTFPTATIGVALGDANAHMPRPSVYAYDFIPNHSAQMLSPTTIGAWTTAIGISTPVTSCADTLAEIADGTLRVDDRPVFTDAGGIFHDPVPHTTTIQMTTDQLIPPGFAVSLDLDPHARITSTSATATDDWYYAQTDPVDGHTVLWFRDALAPGDTITIEPK